MSKVIIRISHIIDITCRENPGL